MLTRSGTNVFHGSLFENWQSDKLLARDPFLPRGAGQAGGALQPVRRDARRGGDQEPRVLLHRVRGVSRNVRRHAERHGADAATARPDPRGAAESRKRRSCSTRSRCPTKRSTRISAATSSPGRARAATTRFLVKADVVVDGGNLSVTFSRMRPETVNPSIFIGSGNDQRFLNEQDRVASQYVLARLELDVGNARRVESQRAGPAERLLECHRSARERRGRSDRSRRGASGCSP